MSKSYNKTKRFEKESFDSEFMNSSQSIKFGVSGRSQNNHSKIKPKSKCFVYKRSRIDKLVIDNITKMKSKEDKATLKKIKEVEDIINKKGELIMLNQQVRLNNAKSNKNH